MLALPATPERRLAAGDPHALDDCYRAFHGLVRHHLRRLVSPNDIDDVVQRVFWEVWRCRSRYDPERSFEAWIVSIARRRAIDHLRARRTGFLTLDRAADLVDSDGRETAERHAHAQVIHDALAQLSSKSRVVLQLAYFDGYTQREIAALLDLPLGTVKTRTSRGLASLGAILRPTEQQHLSAQPMCVGTRPVSDGA